MYMLEGAGKDFRVWINMKGQYKFHLDIKNGLSRNVLNRFQSRIKTFSSEHVLTMVDISMSKLNMWMKRDDCLLFYLFSLLLYFKCHVCFILQAPHL